MAFTWLYIMRRPGVIVIVRRYIQICKQYFVFKLVRFKNGHALKQSKCSFDGTVKFDPNKLSHKLCVGLSQKTTYLQFHVGRGFIAGNSASYYLKRENHKLYRNFYVFYPFMTTKS